jgi:hypothetical protein
MRSRSRAPSPGRRCAFMTIITTTARRGFIWHYAG